MTLPQHVSFSRAREIVDGSTIDPTETMRITLPAGVPDTKWTRLFVIVTRKDLPQAPNPDAPGPVANFSVSAEAPTDSVIARWNPSLDLGDHPVYTLTVTGGYMVQKFLTAETSIAIKGLQVAIDNRYTFSVMASGDRSTGRDTEGTIVQWPPSWLD